MKNNRPIEVGQIWQWRVDFKSRGTKELAHVVAVDDTQVSVRFLDEDTTLYFYGIQTFKNNHIFIM